LQGVIYAGLLRRARNQDNKSNPEYRVTQYIADIVRRRKLEGIIYTSSQLYPYRSHVYGTNLVVLQPRPEMLSIEDFGLYKTYHIPYGEPSFELPSYEIERIV
jgi:hypothetical protein